MVDSWKWMDSRRMTNICERWAKNHTNALQYALFNGDGFESWENVWGTWNGITKRDGEQIRRVGSLLRFLGNRGYLQSQRWIPHSPTTDPSNVFASYWPLEDNTAAWTVVNRALNERDGPTLGNVSSAGVPAGKVLVDGLIVCSSIDVRMHDVRMHDVAWGLKPSHGCDPIVCLSGVASLTIATVNCVTMLKAPNTMTCTTVLK
jgi:hypothetical protein